MPDRAQVVSDDVLSPYLSDAALFFALPAYADLVETAASAEMEWLQAKSAGQIDESKRLLGAYQASLVPRPCRLSGTLLECARAPGGHKAREADLYVRIRLSEPSATYRDRLYECHYTASPSNADALATIKELSERKTGEEVALCGWLERSFCIPGFYLARARVFRGTESAR
jgi:hypothetical protein